MTDPRAYLADVLAKAGGDLPIGTPVRYWPMFREGRGAVSVTRSDVWEIAGEPVVSVEGHAGGIALTHVEVQSRTTSPAMARALIAVLDRHVRLATLSITNSVCGECHCPYPCPTVATITTELAKEIEHG